ncbi:nucleotide disphospho-sugar-binding domain-containing protein [Actinocrispum sp. NPDC049592]|uniref:glycosyltransferase n=1 Tax=Actinocrispum sp. NPDC049592 TaxID=3154835 RepID=UPI00343A0F50
MRVLLSAIGSRGEIEPMLALGVRLLALGHGVRLVAPPDFAGLAEGFGIPFVPIGPDLSKPAPPPMPTSAEGKRSVIEQTVFDQFEIVSEAAKGFDAIVGGGMLQLATHSVAERLGIPYHFGTFAAITLPSTHHAPPPLGIPGAQPRPGESNESVWERDRHRFTATFGKPLNECRTSVGLPEIDDVRGHMCGDDPWLAADPTLGPWPGPGHVVQTGAWIRPDERPLDPELQAFLDAGEPPVYFGFGSMRVPGELGHAAIKSARELGRRVIVQRGWADLSLVDNAPDCIAIGEVNQQALFERVAAVVHHGGAGTTTTVARAAAPQVVIPQRFDQFYWSERVERLGIGRSHPSGEPTTESLVTALGHVLQPEVSALAKAVAAEVATDGAQVAAELIIG